jgi:hypothetical protein
MSIGASEWKRKSSIENRPRFPVGLYTEDMADSSVAPERNEGAVRVLLLVFAEAPRWISFRMSA